MDFEGFKFVDESLLSREEKAARDFEIARFRERWKTDDPFEAVNELIFSKQSRYPAHLADEIRDEILKIVAHGSARYIRRQAKLGADVYAAATSSGSDFGLMYNKVSELVKGKTIDVLTLLAIVANGNGAAAQKVKTAVDKHASERARASAEKSHAANRAMRNEAYEWLDKHFAAEQLTNDQAAERLGKIVPLKFSTRLSYVKKWKRSR